MSPQPQLVLVASIDDEPLGESISPELVLVDPVLAERARALHEPPAPWVPLRVAPAPAPPREVAPAPLEPTSDVSAAPVEPLPPAAPEPALSEPEPILVREQPTEEDLTDLVDPEAAPDPLSPPPALEPPPEDEPPVVPRAVPLSAEVTPLRPALVPPPARPTAAPRPAIPEAPAAPAPSEPPSPTLERPASPLPAAPSSSPPRRLRRAGHSAGMLATGVVVGLVGGVLAADIWMPARSPVAILAPGSGADPSPAVQPEASAPVGAAPSVGGPKASSPSAAPTAAAKDTGSKKTTRVAPKQAKQKASETPSSPVAAAPVPAFVWAAAPGASRYEIVFERGGKVVYSATTRATRLELPRSWRYDGATYRLEPGRYHWTVWPIVGGSRGKPVVSSDYTV